MRAGVLVVLYAVAAGVGVLGTVAGEADAQAVFTASAACGTDGTSVTISWENAPYGSVDVFIFGIDSDTSTGSSVVLTGLTPGTAYTANLRSQPGPGQSGSTESASVVFTCTAPPPPDVPPPSRPPPVDGGSDLDPVSLDYIYWNPTYHIQKSVDYEDGGFDIGIIDLLPPVSDSGRDPSTTSHYTVDITMTIHLNPGTTGHFAGNTGQGTVSGTVTAGIGCNTYSVKISNNAHPSDTETYWIAVVPIAHADHFEFCVAGSTNPVKYPASRPSTGTGGSGSGGASGGSGFGGLGGLVFAPAQPSDSTPPYVVSIQRAGNAAATHHTLAWNVTFSEAVDVAGTARVNHTSVANSTIPDLGMVRDTILVNVPGNVTGGTVAVDLAHQSAEDLVIELVAPDCTRYTVHNQTFAWMYELRRPHILNVTGGAAGPWTLEISDVSKWVEGTLKSWTLTLESDGHIRGAGTEYTFTQYAGTVGNHTLNLAAYDIRDTAGNPLAAVDPDISEPYEVVGTGQRAC